MPRETAAVSAHVLCTTAQIHFIRSHIRRVHVCLAVSCHLPFWQNGRDLLRFIAVTRGRNGHEIRVSTKKGGERKKERKTDRKKEDNDDENLLSFWASDERGESELP